MSRITRVLSIGTLMAVFAIAVVGCGGTTTHSASGGKMSGDKMGDKMGAKMSDKMSDDKMTDKMSDKK
jgi:hypothetical protein